MSRPGPPAPAAERPGGDIPLPPSVKRKIKDGIVAFTVAVWFFVRPWTHLFIDRDRYFLKLPVVPVEMFALVVNISCLGILIWAGICFWRRARSRLLLFALDIVFLSLFLPPADYIRVQFLPLHLGDSLRNPVALFFAALVLGLVLWQHRNLARFAAMAICITFPAMLWTMIKIILVGFNIMHLEQCTAVPPGPPLLPVRANSPRVVWMIFDETDFRLAYEKRPANVALPEFDRVRHESLFADQAYPPGSSTIISMPALTTGRRLGAVAHDDCDLLLTPADGGAATDWSATPTVFSEARQLGCNTALVGWYHPYARLLGASLNYCSWYAMPGFELGRAATFTGSIREQLASLSGHLHTRQLFINVCQDSLRDSLSVVTNPAYGLILLHLPPPHAPGVFLPKENAYTSQEIEPPAGYFNNLVLANNEFGALRAALEKSKLWDQSWIILSTDHWWRRSETYDGISDHRVPFMVKSPAPAAGEVYSRPFNTVLTHDLILAILRRQVTNQADVIRLLDRGHPDPPVIRTGEGSE